MKKYFIKTLSALLAVSLCVMTTATSMSCKVDSVEEDYVKIEAGVLPEKDSTKDYSPLKKYDKVVTLKVLGTDYQIIGEVPPKYNGSPSGPANNAFNDAALQYLNIKLQYVSIVTGETYEQRLNNLIAANEVPDIFRTSDVTTFDTLRKTGLVANLADSFYYLNDDLQTMYKDANYYDGLESCMAENKLYAFPNIDNPYESAQKLYIRKDWLDIVKKPIPTTYEELVDVAKAFKAKASDISATEEGISAKDIIPIGITKEIATMGNNTAQGFFNIFGTQPDAFFEKDGKLVSANTTDEMKNALSELNKLYNDGLLAKEFYNYSDAKVANDIIAGKIGIISGMWHAASSPLQESLLNEYTPSAEWVSINLPSYNGKETLPVVNRVKIQDYNMVSRKCEHPEALAKLSNLFYDMFYSDDAFEKYGSLSTQQGGFFYSWVPAKIWYTSYTMESYERVLSVFNRLYNGGFRISDEKYSQMLVKGFNWKEYYSEMASDSQYGQIFNELKIRERDNGFKYGYPFMQALKAGKKTAQMNEIERRGFGIYEQCISNTGGYAYVTQLSKGEKKAKFSEFYGIKTPSQQNYGEYLNTSMKKYYLEVISGANSVDNWDKFVADYNKNGGKKVLNQVNQWYL